MKTAHRSRPSWLLCLLLLAALLTLATNPVFAADDEPAMRARAVQILPGDSIAVSGSGFEPGQQLWLFAGDEQLNAEALVVDEQGNVKGEVRVPETAAVGLLPVTVRGDDNQIARFEFMVSKVLPPSGQDGFEIVQNQLADGLYQVAYSANNDAVFVTRSAFGDDGIQSELLKVDPQTLEVIDSTTPPAAPPRNRDGDEDPTALGLYSVFGIAVDSANETVWVTNSSRGTAAVYRQGDVSLARQFPIDAVPHARSIRVAAEAGKVFATTIGTGYVAVFDTATLQQLDNIDIAASREGKPFSPMGLALDADDGTLYVSSLASPKVAVIDIASGKVENVIVLDQARSLRDMAWDAENELLLVADYGSDSLLIVNPDSGKVVHDVYVGANPLAVTWDAASGLAYVANWGAGTVAVVDASAGKLVANLPIGPSPIHVVADGSGNVFVVNKDRGPDKSKGNRITRIAVTAD